MIVQIGKIDLSIVSNGERCIDLTPNCSARGYATLVITPKISKEQETQMVEQFNEYLNGHVRNIIQCSLQIIGNLKTISRKRISFDFSI